MAEKGGVQGRETRRWLSGSWDLPTCSPQISAFISANSAESNNSPPEFSAESQQKRMRADGCLFGDCTSIQQYCVPSQATSTAPQPLTSATSVLWVTTDLDARNDVGSAEAYLGTACSGVLRSDNRVFKIMKDEIGDDGDVFLFNMPSQHPSACEPNKVLDAPPRARTRTLHVPRD